jgi:hypothetical protein
LDLPFAEVGYPFRYPQRYSQAVWGGPDTRVVGFRSWAVAGVAAFVGWLLAVLLLLVGLRPLGWVLLAAAVTSLALVTLYARARAFRPWEVFGFSFACIVLEWPVLGLVTLLILSWAHVTKWE